MYKSFFTFIFLLLFSSCGSGEIDYLPEQIGEMVEKPLVVQEVVPEKTSQEVKEN